MSLFSIVIFGSVVKHGLFLFWKSRFLVGTSPHQQSTMENFSKDKTICYYASCYDKKNWRATWNRFQNAINVWHLTTTSLFFVVAILPVVFVVSSTPSFFEYWVSSLFTDMHIIKSKAANDLGNGGPPENYAPKILKCWKEKSQNQSCWYFRTPPHANHESLFSAHFLSCTSEYLGHSRRFPRNDCPRGNHSYTLEYLLSREASSTGWSPSPPSSTCTMHHMISHRKSVEAVRIKERKITPMTSLWKS